MISFIVWQQPHKGMGNKSILEVGDWRTHHQLHWLQCKMPPIIKTAQASSRHHHNCLSLSTTGGKIHNKVNKNQYKTNSAIQNRIHSICPSDHKKMSIHNSTQYLNIDTLIGIKCHYQTWQPKEWMERCACAPQTQWQDISVPCTSDGAPNHTYSDVHNRPIYPTIHILLWQQSLQDNSEEYQLHT